MKAYDPALVRLVDELAGMAQPDREFVLSELSEAECALLEPLLTCATREPSSPRLKALLEQCEVGVPPGLTPRTRECLLVAARPVPAPAAPFSAEQRAMNEPSWARYVGRVLGRAGRSS